MADLISSLFGNEGIKVETNDPVSTENLKEFRPNYKKGGDKGQYEAVIRFLPNPENPENLSIVQKWTVFLKNPITNQGKTIDSPSSVGEPDPLTEMFFALRNSKNAQVNSLQDNFKRHQNFYSIIQVVECQQEPALTNKILVWKYGQKIYEKIRQEMTPVMQGQAPRQPFDLFKGRLFKVVAVKQNDFNNLDQSFFFDIAYPNNCMRVEIDNPQMPGQKQVTYATMELAQSDQGRKIISDYLINNAPKLSEFSYKPWDADTKKYVDDMILLHGQLLNGAPLTQMQQSSMASAMTVAQPSVANVTSMPNVQIPGTNIPGSISVPGISEGIQVAPSPDPVVPQTPSLGSILSGQSRTTPVYQSGVGQPNMPQTSVAPSTPSIPGLSIGQDANTIGNIGAQVPSGTPNVQGIDMSNLDSIMSSTSAPSASNPNSAPGVGNIDEILNHTVM